MRLHQYLTEDAEAVLDYKKTIFDLRTAVGELEYQEKQTPPIEREKKDAFNDKTRALKEKIIRLKQSILKQSQELGESIKPALQEVLDSIPDPPEEETNEGVMSLFKKKANPKLDKVKQKLIDGKKIEDWDREVLIDYFMDYGMDDIAKYIRKSSNMDSMMRKKLINHL